MQPATKDIESATAGQTEHITECLLESLRISGYVKPGTDEMFEKKARCLILRFKLEAYDAKLLLGMVRQIVWKLRQRKRRRRQQPEVSRQSRASGYALANLSRSSLEAKLQKPCAACRFSIHYGSERTPSAPPLSAQGLQNICSVRRMRVSPTSLCPMNPLPPALSTLIVPVMVFRALRGTSGRTWWTTSPGDAAAFFGGSGARTAGLGVAGGAAASAV